LIDCHAEQSEASNASKVTQADSSATPQNDIARQFSRGNSSKSYGQYAAFSTRLFDSRAKDGVLS